MTILPLEILVLDDEAMLLDLLPAMLEPHSTVCCSSLSDACEAISQDSTKFDLLLCDLMMPKGGGLDLHKWLLEHHPALSEKVIFVTGGIGQDLEERVLATNQPVLYKPFSIAKLHETLGKIVSS